VRTFLAQKTPCALKRWRRRQGFTHSLDLAAKTPAASIAVVEDDAGIAVKAFETKE
jgi:hypothetical protein